MEIDDWGMKEIRGVFGSAAINYSDNACSVSKTGSCHRDDIQAEQMPKTRNFALPGAVKLVRGKEKPRRKQKQKQKQKQDYSTSATNIPFPI